MDPRGPHIQSTPDPNFMYFCFSKEISKHVKAFNFRKIPLVEKDKISE
jgi:hypothetical protein